jgi:regulator of protease activity HflC (stomatin/prohibitin superfamily)
MKKIFVLLMLVCTMILTGCSYEKVPAGNVGIQFNLYGADKGVQAKEVGPGRYWLSWNEEIYRFPTFTQTWVYDKDLAMEFGTVEGLNVSADIGITYHIQPEKVTLLFQTYRKGVDEITDTYLRNMIRDSLVKRASMVGVEYGKGKAELIESVQADVQAQVKDIGIVIERINWVGGLRLPQNVTNSINAKIQSTQMAEQRNNEIAQSKAEADKEVAKATGDARVRTLNAEAEANAIKIQGEALRQSPGVVQLRWIEKWDGRVAQTQLGSNTTTLMQMPAAPKE